METSRIDIYQKPQQTYYGRISTRLNVITDPRSIKDYMRVARTSSPIPTISNQPLLPSKGQQSTSKPKAATEVITTPYAANVPNKITRLLYLLALGPMTKTNISLRTQLSETDLEPLLSTHAQPYNPNDSFIIDDIFPNGGIINDDDESVPYILKDKSYKDLRPWEWQFYSDEERNLIIHNIHNALTRLGFLETHPLRRKICDKPGPTNSTTNAIDTSLKKSTLGGGILTGLSKKSPIRKASPKPIGGVTQTNISNDTNVINLTSNNINNIGGSPLKNNKRKLSSSSSSSDDEKLPNKKRPTRKGLSKNSINESGTNLRTGIHNTNQITTGHVSDSSTSPSSINEELEPERINLNQYTSGRLASPHIALAESKDLKKLQFYNNLALKFKLKYKEYEELYKQLQNNSNKSNGEKKNVTRLFELHNQLSEWKRKLWDFENQSKLKLDIMTLQKHRKPVGKSQSESPSMTPVARKRTAPPEPRLPMKPALFQRSLDY